MRHECKITVIDKKCFADYQEKYLADPKSGPCPFFNVGDEFILKRTPLSVEPFALSHQMTAKSLSAIGEIGGPRCCKRDSYLSILSAIDFVKEHFGVEMECPEIVCEYASQNNQCIGKRCPFNRVNHKG